VLHDLDAAFDDHEETEIAVTLGEEHLAGADRVGMAALGQGGQVLGTESGKRDVLIVGHMNAL
jgi:hypothetical protein